MSFGWNVSCGPVRCHAHRGRGSSRLVEPGQSTRSILLTVFDDEEPATAVAAWNAVAVVGLVGGPVLGGVAQAEHGVFGLRRATGSPTGAQVLPCGLRSIKIVQDQSCRARGRVGSFD